MAMTNIGVGDAKAIKKYSAFLAVDTANKSYFTRKFSGGPESSMPIHHLDELESDAGEYISYDISMQMQMAPIEGDDILENKEEALNFYTDGMYINQARGGVNTGGRMTRKRTIHNLRKIARKRQSDWWARAFDELHFMYLSGARGVNTDFVWGTSFTSFAGNSLSSPDSYHIIYANATTKATMDADDKLDLADIDRAVGLLAMTGGGSEGIPAMQPIQVDGEEHFVLIINPWQEYDLRINTGSGQWLDLQKALATSIGKNSPIFKGGAGMHNNVVIHKHKKIIRFSDYGAGSPGTVAAARALLLGSQAAVVAFGSPGTGLRFGWNEETRDNGNQVVITSHSILGMKKVTFNSLDFGVFCIDTAAKDPGA